MRRRKSAHNESQTNFDSDCYRGWTVVDLKEVDEKKTPAVSTSVLIHSDMFSANISVDQMVRTADFETYIFSANPAWTSEGQISSGPDEGSSTSLMFNTIYPAKDGRHVILTQMQSLTRYHAGALKKMEEMGHPGRQAIRRPMDVKCTGAMKKAKNGGQNLRSRQAVLNLRKIAAASSSKPRPNISGPGG